jgi:short-subunit dehydrogenase
MNTTPSHRTVLITGASSGIGAALTRACTHRGWTVYAVARRADRLHELFSQDSHVHAITADISTESGCQQVVDALNGATVDILVNNAGRGNYASVEDTSTEQWHSMFAVNVDGPFFLTRALLPGMKQRNSGHIINISSVAGRQGFPLNAAYVAAKHAVVGFTAALRAELIGTGVHATVICPAGVLTEWGGVTEGGSINDLYGAAIPRSRTIANERGLTLAPLSRMMTAEEVAEIILRAIDAGRVNDVFTHEGTLDLAAACVADRIAVEDSHAALWLAMAEVYAEVYGEEHGKK